MRKRMHWFRLFVLVTVHTGLLRLKISLDNEVLRIIGGFFKAKALARVPRERRRDPRADAFALCNRRWHVRSVRGEEKCKGGCKWEGGRHRKYMQYCTLLYSIKYGGRNVRVVIIAKIITTHLPMNERDFSSSVFFFQLTCWENWQNKLKCTLVQITLFSFHVWKRY